MSHSENDVGFTVYCLLNNFSGIINFNEGEATTAGDIEETADIEVLNPDHVICTLDENAEMRMEFVVDSGKGYVPAERNRPEDAPIGLIPVDSLYSPVKRVSYKV